LKPKNQPYLKLSPIPKKLSQLSLIQKNKILLLKSEPILKEIIKSAPTKSLKISKNYSEHKDPAILIKRPPVAETVSAVNPTLPNSNVLAMKISLESIAILKLMKN
jgi:hypothetical protein